MNKAFIAFSALALAYASNAQAYRLVILTNETTEAKAKEIKSFMQGLPPFKYLSASELQIQIEQVPSTIIESSCDHITVKYSSDQIKSLQSWATAQGVAVTQDEQKNLQDGFSIARDVVCDHDALASLAKRYDGDRTLIVIDREGSGGSGGEIPTVTSHARATVAIHELLHTFGFGDEYKYSPTEALLYCTQQKWVNVAAFQDQPPYRDSADAVARHGAVIPWLAALGPKPDLTTGDKLGTGRFGRMGLYPSHVCDEAHIKTWVAQPYTTIMQSIQSTYIPIAYWPSILSAMGVGAARAKAVGRKPEQPLALRSLKATPEEIAAKTPRL